METEKIFYKIVDSPIGKFIAGATSKGCCIYEFLDRGGLKRIKTRVEKRYKVKMVEGANQFIDKMESQVKEYFQGKRKKFSLKLDLQGTKFEILDWLELMKIPYGETRSYGEIAKQLGKPGAARAVGRANGANYLPIIIPCHRVIEANGNLRGYGGKLWRKKFLLDLEKKMLCKMEGTLKVYSIYLWLFGFYINVIWFLHQYCFSIPFYSIYLQHLQDSPLLLR